MLDRLVQFVVEKVAFAGEYGAPIESVSLFVSNFFYERERRTGLAAPLVDDAYINFVWGLLMTDSPIHVVFAAQRIKKGPSPDAAAATDDEEESEDDGPKKKKQKRREDSHDGLGDSIAVGKGQKKLSNDADVPMYEIDEADQHLSLDELRNKYDNLRLMVKFEISWPILTGTHEKITKITDPVWKVLQFVASAGPSGVAATEIGRYCNVHQKKVDSLTRGLVGLRILYKKKMSHKGTTVNQVYHRAFWDNEQDRPMIEIETERITATESRLSMDQLLSVSLVESRILNLLKQTKVEPQSGIAAKIGFDNPDIINRRRLRRIISDMAERGLVIMRGSATPHGRYLYWPEAISDEEPGPSRIEQAFSPQAAAAADDEDDGEDGFHGLQRTTNVEYGHMRAHVPVPRQIIDLVKDAGSDGTDFYVGLGLHQYEALLTLERKAISNELDGLDHRFVSRYLEHMIQHPAPDYLSSERVAFVKNRSGREEYKQWFIEGALDDNLARASGEPVEPRPVQSLPEPDARRFYDSQKQLDRYMAPFKKSDGSFTSTGRPSKATSTTIERRHRIAAAKAGKKRAQASRDDTDDDADSSDAAPTKKKAKKSTKGKERASDGSRRGRPRKTPLKPGEETYYARKKREAAERAAAGLPPPPKRGPEFGGRRPKGWVKSESRGESEEVAASPTDETNAEDRPTADGPPQIPEAGSSQPVKRTRGRPRKSAPAETPAPIDAPEPSTSTMQAPAAPAAETPALADEPPKRKRGRPRKNSSKEPEPAPTPAPETGPADEPQGSRASSSPSTAVAVDFEIAVPSAVPAVETSAEPAVEAMQVDESQIASTSRVDSASDADRVDVEQPAQKRARVANGPSTATARAGQKPVVDFARLQKQKDIMAYIESQGGVIDFISTRFAEAVQHFLEQQHESEGRKDKKTHRMDRSLLAKLMKILVDEKQLREQKGMFGTSGKVKHIYYLAHLDPDGPEFKAFVDKLDEAAAAKARPAADEAKEVAKKTPGRPRMRILDEPMPGDSDETVQDYFASMPKIFGSRYGMVHGKYAAMRVLHGFMVDMVNVERSGHRFNMLWMYTRIPLRTLLYISELLDPAPPEVDRVLRDPAQQGRPIQALSQDVIFFLGIQNRMSARRRLYNLLEDMKEIGLIERFEDGAADEPIVVDDARRAKFIVLSGTAPVYDFRRKRSGQSLSLVSVQDVTTRIGVSKFWDTQHDFATKGRGVVRKKSSKTSDLYPPIFEGSRKVTEDMSRRHNWEDSSVLRTAQREYVEKVVESRQDSISTDDIKNLARLVYATEEAVRLFVEGPSQIDAVATTGQEVADNVAALQQFAHGAVAHADRPSTSTAAASKIAITTTGKPSDFVGKDFNWAPLKSKRMARGSLRQEKFVELILDAAVIVKERAERLGKAVPWHAISKLLPDDVSIEPDRIRALWKSVTGRKLENGIYWERLSNTWDRLWNAHGGSEALPDPCPGDPAHFDIGRYVLFLRDKVDKAVLKPSRAFDVSVGVGVDDQDALLPETLEDVLTGQKLKRHRIDPDKLGGLNRAGTVGQIQHKLASQALAVPARLPVVASIESSVEADVALRYAKMIIKSAEGQEQLDEATLDLLQKQTGDPVKKLSTARLAIIGKSQSRQQPDDGEEPDQALNFTKKWHDSFKTFLSDRAFRDVGPYGDTFNALFDSWTCPVDLSESDGLVAAICHVVSAGKHRLKVNADVTYASRKALGYSSRSAVDQDVENEVVVQSVASAAQASTIVFDVASPDPPLMPAALSEELASLTLSMLPSFAYSKDVIDSLWKPIERAQAAGVSEADLLKQLATLDSAEDLTTWFELLALEGDNNEPPAFVAGIKDAVVVSAQHRDKWSIRLATGNDDAEDDDEDERYIPVYWLSTDGTVDESAWADAVTWVRATLTSYPGLRGVDLVRQAPSPYMLSFVEVKMILEQMCESGLVKPSYGPSGLELEWPRVLWHAAHWHLTYKQE